MEGSLRGGLWQLPGQPQQQSHLPAPTGQQSHRQLHTAGTPGSQVSKTSKSVLEVIALIRCPVKNLKKTVHAL